MDYKSTISGLYYLLICADGKVNERELTLGRQMATKEGINVEWFNAQLELLKAKDKETIYTEALAGLKKLNQQQQISCIAWLCVIANADGFMDKDEWILIYKIYHTELRLSLDDIMKTQRELNQIVHGKAFHSLGVRVAK